MTMAVITLRRVSARGLSHTPEVDLLESGDKREPVALRRRLRSGAATRLPPWAVALVAGALVATGIGGASAAVELRAERAREAARVQVDVLPVGGSSSTVGGVARGELRLLLVNQQDRRVQLGALQVEVEGLRVLQVEPPFEQPLGPREERAYRVAFVVPDCSRLVLPGAVLVSLSVDGGPLQRQQVPVREPDDQAETGGVALGACPPSSRGARPGTPTDVAARPAGGSSQRSGAGAQGVARLEVRNAGAPLQLLTVSGEIPGVAFGDVRIEGGRSVETDGLVIVRLSFRIPDCRALRPAGRLLLTVSRRGAVQELALSAVAEPEGGVGPQITLPVVYRACA
jgi:hypothetical protein